MAAPRPGRVRDALNGVWLGHPLHPVLAHGPVGMHVLGGVIQVCPPDAG